MARSRIDFDTVVNTALQLADQQGLGALTLSNVAEVLEVRPSALYTHIDGADHLHYVVAVTATNNLTNAVRNAAIGVAGRDAVESTVLAYHQFATDHPGQYRATLAPPTGEDDHLDTACSDLLDVFQLVLAGLGLNHAEADAAAVSMRSTLHGFMALQPTSRQTGDMSQHVQTLTNLLLDGLSPRQP